MTGASIELRENGSEAIRYNAPGYPLRSRRDNLLSDLIHYAADCHWHTDFEFVTCQRGGMTYRVNGEDIALGEGDVLFVNSRRLHYGRSPERKECVYAFVLMSPALLGGAEAVTELLAQLADDGAADWWRFPAGEPETAEAAALLLTLCDHPEPAEAMTAIAAAAGLIRLALGRAGEVTRAMDPAWGVVRRMVGYIQDHYREKIALEDIAAAGAVCRSRCCALFREKLGVSPVNYINSHRLHQACGLLATGASVTEAAFGSGFQSSSYFAETFRKAYGTTPTAWRAARQAAAGER